MATGNFRLISYAITRAQNRDEETICDLFNRVFSEIPIIAHILALCDAVSMRNDSVYTLNRKQEQITPVEDFLFGGKGACDSSKESPLVSADNEHEMGKGNSEDAIRIPNEFVSILPP